jgi:Domain of unknown function (DUF4412)
MLRVFICIGIFTSFIFSAANLRAAEFTANMLQKKGEKTISGTLYVKNELYRIEQKSNGEEVVILVNTKTNKTIILNKAGRQFMEISNDSGQSLSNNPFASAAYTRSRSKVEKDGQEKIAGIVCEKIKLLQQGHFVMTIWESSDLGFIMKIKMNSTRERLTTLSKVKKKTLENSLFQVPAGYSELVRPTRVPTPDPAKQPAIRGKSKGTAPISRLIGAGGELRLSLSEKQHTTVNMKGEIREESKCIVTPLKKGGGEQQIYTLATKGETATRKIGKHAQADGVMIKVTKGLVHVTVEQQNSLSSSAEKKSFHIAGSGKSMLLRSNQPLSLKIAGDSQESKKSKIEVTFYKGKYKDVKKKEKITLKNGASKDWQISVADQIKSLQIKVNLKGGVKVWWDQSSEK